jgi:hypothetical protein
VKNKLFGEQPAPNSTLSIINPTLTGLGSYTALCGEGSMNNCLANGKTFLLLMLGVLHERC